MVLDAPSNVSYTAETMAACEIGEIRELAKTVNRLAVERKLLEEMKKRKIGSPELECQAYWLGKRKGGKMIEGEVENKYKANIKGKSKGKSRLEASVPWSKVQDAVDMHLKYCRREERRVREQYRQKKRVLRNNVKDNRTKERRLNRVMEQIHIATQEIWIKGGKEIERKLS